MGRVFKEKLIRIPVLGRILLLGFRTQLAFRSALAPFFKAVRWVFTSRETTNFTYDLEADNKRYLAAMVACIFDIPFDQVMGYIDELEVDMELQKHILETTSKSDFALVADSKVYYGRRIGWYAVARAMKPRVIVETGIDKGLGACVLTAALRKNSSEGVDGRYYGTDINPRAGYLFAGKYREWGTILYGDSIESLRSLDVEIDLFINDSDHSLDYESEEYETVSEKLSSRSVILSDNARCSSRLLDYSLNRKRNYLYYQENPVHHWFPGAGTGFSFVK